MAPSLLKSMVPMLPQRDFLHNPGSSDASLQVPNLNVTMPESQARQHHPLRCKENTYTEGRFQRLGNPQRARNFYRCVWPEWQRKKKLRGAWERVNLGSSSSLWKKQGKHDLSKLLPESLFPAQCNLFQDQQTPPSC